MDGGVTWSVPKRINDDSSTNGAWHWFGTMSVAPNGRIDVVWHDTRDDPNNILSRLYSSWSTDEGVTWSTNLAMTPQWNSQVGFPNQNRIGDYYTLISDNTYAYLAYSATFNGEQDVYFMKYRPNDCNNNEILDTCEIAAGEDANGNGIPDSCEPYPACGTCKGDLTGDGLVDEQDIAMFINCYLAFPTVLPTCGCADMTSNHQVNAADLTPFVNKLLAGGCP